MPFVRTSAVTASGASVANHVAAIEVPKSHHGKLRPATKKSVIFFELCFTTKTPMPMLKKR